MTLRSRHHLCFLLLGLLAACGGEAPPPAHYAVFTLELVDLTEGERVLPGTTLTYQTRYIGDLARDLRYTALLTHEASGETASFEWSEHLQDTARIDFRRNWTLRHAFLKKPGRIRVQLQASLTATKTGSTPWVVQSESVYVELYPTLDRVEVTLPSASPPVACGAPIKVQVGLLREATSLPCVRPPERALRGTALVFCSALVGLRDAAAQQPRLALLAQPVAVALDEQRVAVVQQPVEDGGGQHVIPEDSSPLAHHLVGGDEQAALLVAVRQVVHLTVKTGLA